MYFNMDGNQTENRDIGENGEKKSKKKRNGYVTAIQKERLIDYVTCNYVALFGKELLQNGKNTKDELWTVIAVELNAIGAIKDVPGWKRCYASLKFLTNRKLKNCETKAPKILNTLETKIVNASQLIPSNVLKTVNSSSSTTQKEIRISTDLKTIGKNSTMLQRQHLVSMVSKNYDALFGKLSNSANGDIIKKKVWKSIANHLNSVGPKKDIKGWIRCFTGLKGSTKFKLSTIRQNKNRNSKANIQLDTIQSEMLKMHHPGTLDGCETIDEMGFGRHTVQLNTNKLKNCTLAKDTGSVELFASQETNTTPDIEIDFVNENLIDFNQMNKKACDLDKRLAVLSKKLEVIGETSDMDQVVAEDLESLQVDDPHQTDSNMQIDSNVIENNGSQNPELNDIRFLDLSNNETLRRNWLRLTNPDPDADLPDFTEVPYFTDLTEEEQFALIMCRPDQNSIEGNEKIESEENESMESDFSQEYLPTTELEEVELDITAATPLQADKGGSHTKTTILNNKATGGDKSITDSNVIVLDVITIPTAMDNQLPTNTGSVQEPSTSIIHTEISPTVSIQQRPQRRGVEINLNKFVEARQVASEIIIQDNPRRNRLSTPLGVMAEMALAEQKISNNLLARILSELQNQRN